MSEEADNVLTDLAIEGVSLLSDADFNTTPLKFADWETRVALALARKFPSQGLDLKWLSQPGHGLTDCGREINQRFRDFDSRLRQRILWLSEIEQKPSPIVKRGKGARTQNKEVFIVHGRDDNAKNAVKSLILDLGLTPIILHEMANKGRHILDKFEDEAKGGFAIVIATSDDIGGLNLDDVTLLPRARQNVVFELGYFVGAFGRENVCVLWAEELEKPTDYEGMMRIPYGQDQRWKIKLAQELTEAGFDVNPAGLLLHG